MELNIVKYRCNARWNASLNIDGINIDDLNIDVTLAEPPAELTRAFNT